MSALLGKQVDVLCDQTTQTIPHMAALGAEIVNEERQTPESLQKWVKSEIEKWTPILKAEGMSVN